MSKKAEAKLSEIPREKRVCRGEFHLEICQDPAVQNFSRFMGMPLEKFVDFAAEELGVEVWYTALPRTGHFSPMLQSDRPTDDARECTIPADVIDRFVKRAHHHDVTVIAAFNMNLWPGLGLRHPEWLIQDIPDGRQRNANPHQKGFMCHNTPFADWVCKFLADFVERYGVDGVWFDDCNFGPRNAWPWSAGCICEGCQKKYHEETGRDLPEFVDFSDREFKLWVNWRYENLRQFQKRITESVRAVRSDAMVRFNSYPRPGITWAAANELAPIQDDMQFFFETDYGNLDPTQAAKIAAARGDCEIWGFPPLQLGALLTSPYQDKEFCSLLSLSALSHGVMTENITDWFDLKGQLKFAFDMLKERREFIVGESVRECGLHLSQQSRDFYYSAQTNPQAQAVDAFRDILAKNSSLDVLYTADVFNHAMVTLSEYVDGCNDFWKNWVGASEMLLQRHIVNDVLFDASITSEGLAGYKALVLANSACLSDEQCRAITEWVKDGGTLIATYETSLFDELGERRDNFGLAEALGVDYCATYDRDGKGGTIYVPQGDLKNEFGEWMVMAGQHTEFCVTDPKNVDILYNLSNRKRLEGSPNRGLTGHPDGTHDSGHPGVSIHQFGKGQAIYISCDAGLAFSDHPLTRIRRFFGDLVERANLMIRVDAPSRLHVHALRVDDNTVNIHLYQRMRNMVPWDFHHYHQVQWDALDERFPIHDIKVKLPGAQIKKVQMPLQAKALEVQDESFVVPKVHLHEVVQVTLERNKG